jgi:ATP-dependent helicase/nuclease subunit A
MAEETRTEQQRTAITTTGRDLLVAASAGTGKTTVLAARCLHLRIHENVPLREILAVTFTEAAAADMRRKIADGLRQYVNSHPENSALVRELMLIDRAPISTLHAFCLKVLREHFHQVDLDPGFSVIDPDEAELLKGEVADELLEGWFGRDDQEGSRFLALAEAYGGRGGTYLAHTIRRLHEFLQTLPDPDHWRARVRDAYRAENGFCELVWYEPYRELWLRELDYCRSLADDGLLLAEQSPGGESYQARLEEIRAYLERWTTIVAAQPTPAEWDTIRQEVRALKWDTVRGGRGADKDALAALKELSETLKDRITKFLGSRLAAHSTKECLQALGQVGPLVGLLLDLQVEFERAYAAAKAQRWLVDFHDLERLCLRLLSSSTAAADSVRRRFRHVLVDEYQDINPLQDAILERLCRNPGGQKVSDLFLVGDEKQSIYGFRLAAPDIFLRKFRQFSPDLQAPEVRVPLTHNYRCRPEIIDGVNHVFTRIATARLGNPYGEESSLTYGADYPASPLVAEPIPVEVHLLEREVPAAANDREEPSDVEEPEEIGARELTVLEREAWLVAGRIDDLVRGAVPVWDARQKAYRPVSYRDIVVLLRTMQGRAEAFADVLRKRGVPVYADLTTGFFSATEVRDVVALLEVLDNAQQDVPLAAVLRSPLVGLNDNDLAAIRTGKAEGAFHGAVREYSEKGKDPRIRDRVRRFLEDVDRWRRDARQLPLARVVWQIYRETNYLEYVQGLPGGESRHANLVRLHDRARQFDQFTHRGLFRFLRFLRRLQEADQDLGTAAVLSESDDVVRIMSIHKSKGLEFPIVFVPDLGKPFNFRDTYDRIQFHRSLLAGADIVDLDRLVRAPTLPKFLISDAKRLEVLAEEQRLLYVALTRARERLILTGTAPLATAGRNWGGPKAAEGRLVAARCALDWLGPVWAGHFDTAETLGQTQPQERHDESRFLLTLHSADAVRSWTPTWDDTAPPGIDREALLSLRPIPVDSATTSPAVREACARLQWKYPTPHLRNLPGKVNVTGFKRHFETATEDDPPGRHAVRRSIVRKPSFLTERASRVTAVERGSATHAVLQQLNLAGILTRADIEAQLASLVQRHVLGTSQAAVVDIDSIVNFLNRPLGLRLRKAQRLQRELPFSLLLPAGELPDAGPRQLGDEERGESVLVQGVIDCLFWEDGPPVLIDYKTDDVAAADVLFAVAEHRIQMNLYLRAARAVYGHDVSQCYLVFLTPGVDVEL